MNGSGTLSGKVALITGAGSGIGRATASLFASEGATVWCADIDEYRAAETADQLLQAGLRATACRLDVSVELDWELAVARMIGAESRFDVLVNSAGISFAAPVAEMSLDDWHRVFRVNLDGVFLGTKHALRVMKGGGSIVHVSSASGIRAPAGASAYATSKAAACMFSRAAARECREQGIPVRINTVCPGGVKTPMWRTMPFFQELVEKLGSDEAAFQTMCGAKPGSRFAEPDEIARAILYLASDAAAYVTGHDLVIDDGYVL